MKVAVVGGGFTGLAAGWELAKTGQDVVIFEKEGGVGGLAGGFRPTGWDWKLERYYHHIFAGDKEAITLAREVGWPAFFTRPRTDSLIGGQKKQLDSALSLLRFDCLSFWSRAHMGAGLALLKLIRKQGSLQSAGGLGSSFAALRTVESPGPSFAWSSLERYRVVDMLPKLVGQEAYEKVWEPLLRLKFGGFLSQVNMAWFWARVNKRTPALGYFNGGFERLAERLAEKIVEAGGRFERRQVTDIKLQILDKGFDKVLVTTPAPVAEKMLRKALSGTDDLLKREFPQIDYLWGQTLILELDNRLMDGYWLNILEENWPFLVVVEQTNFVDKDHYGGRHVVYLGNYLEDGDDRLNMNAKDLLALYLPYIKKINSDFDKDWVRRRWKFQDPYAQPVFPVDYSRQLPKIKTGIPGVYMANMSMVYPWDRGVNFAIELGQKAAQTIIKDIDSGQARMTMEE